MNAKENNSGELWVFVDRRRRRLFEIGLKVLAKARGLAGQMSATTAAIVMGSSAKAHDDCLAFETAAEECVAGGADRVYLFDYPDLEPARPDIFTAVISEAVKKNEPALALFPLTDLGRELAARLARIFNAGLIADAESLVIKDGRVCAWCAAWGGEVMAEIYFSDHDKTGFVTVSPLGGQDEVVRGDPGEIVRVEIKDVETPPGLSLVSSEPEREEHRRLEDAEQVVVGGAGLGSAEGFGLARDLAKALGAEIGATRPAVLLHWADEERLIGQTGKTVRPRLLVSAGASGAVQYTAGIGQAKTILAINRDPNAPIFDIADLGVVADAKMLLPALTEKIKQEKMRRLADLICDQESPEAKPEGFGKRIAEMRKAHGWSIEELAEASVQTPDFIQQLEADEVTPSVAFLLRLAKAFEVDPSTFLTDGEKTAIRDQRKKEFVKRTQNYSYQTLTPGAKNEHLRAFMINIEPRQAHKPVAYKHEGEEFVFVMEGELELTLGKRTHLLKPGESEHFNSETPHKLKSLSDEPTRCLVILYTP